jgi:hypothetical protein
LGAWGLAIALVLALVAPVSAGAGPTRLSAGSASPGSGTTATVISFAVTYRNREGSPADWVRVQVAGSAHAMTTSGTDWKTGVLFKWSGKLPAGVHIVTFEAMSRDRFTDSLVGASVTVIVPATPAPTPKPTPKATPKPTPKPVATPRPTARPTAAPTAHPTAAATARPTAVATNAPTSTPGPTANTTPSATSAPPPSPTPVATPLGTMTGPGASPSDAAIGFVPAIGTPADPIDPMTPAGNDPANPGAKGTRGVSDGAQGPFAALASAMGALDGARPVLPLGLIGTLVTTTGLVGVAMGFGLFGKRRRDGEPPDSDEVLAAAAARGVSVAGANPYGFSDPAPADAAAAAAALLLDPEMAMPRWRRPSLLEARRADPLRDTAAAPRLTFDHGLVGALDGRERRLIGYNVVRLLDSPDELRGAEIGFLDQGDEVQLLEKRGVYWLVLCPDGRQGWIHKMTLGDLVGQMPATSPPTATMPIAAETWTMGDDVDGDVLSAYLESRRRA